MLWPADFESRLVRWRQLRDRVADLDLETYLMTINDWWFQTPWQPYYLHWDDRKDWPDPWQLLDDNIYCDLARGLGILYTIALCPRTDLQSVELIGTKDYNLVQVNDGKYILNWEVGSVVNTNLLQQNQITRVLRASELDFK